MGYRKFVSMNIAIIGLCKVCEALAQGLAFAGHEIYIGVTENDDTSKLDNLLDEFENINVTSIETAATIADIIIITAPADDVREIAYQLNDVRKKVIIDACAAPKKAIEYSNTVNAIKAITGSPHVVKCFNCTGYENLLNPGYEEEAIDMFVAGDSMLGKEIAKYLAKDLGFADCHDFGGSDTIQLLENMARCWQNLAIKQKMGRKIAFKLIKR